MPTNLIVTFIARDRPGVVEQLSLVVVENGGNWLESRMSQLDNTFAGVARVAVSDANATTLRGALSALDEDGFQVNVREAGEPKSEPSGAEVTFEIDGPDHKGIVHELTKTIAGLGASVEEMETGYGSAPMGGGATFSAKARVRLPAGLSEEDFKDALEDSAGSLFVDIVIGEDG